MKLRLFFFHFSSALILGGSFDSAGAAGDKPDLPEKSPPAEAPDDEPDPFGSADENDNGGEGSMAMNNLRLGALIETIDPNVEGQLGFWQFEIEGTTLICVTDERADRMRVMVPIIKIQDVTGEQLAECMKANFDRALDARYCVDGDVLYGAFIHPLRDLTPRLFLSAVEQVFNIRATFGTTYTSGALIFQGGEDDDEKDSGKKPEVDPKKGTRA